MSEKDDKPDPRCYLYHSECPQGQIFVGKKAIDAAKKKGWKDSPTKVDGGDAKDADE